MRGRITVVTGFVFGSDVVAHPRKSGRYPHSETRGELRSPIEFPGETCHRNAQSSIADSRTINFSVNAHGQRPSRRRKSARRRLISERKFPSRETRTFLHRRGRRRARRDVHGRGPPTAPGALM
ncbi:hypothetical protein EVAR_8336_1 [Eumeta japonica]|uniref:Uncharacterized protein n=1 Tax=Eumeta variegata TaxID=151549 RepID=A0A4C1VCZ0_EUMVA|nr:hypothetical protein EVAR_8336_1 [Eumeta japonica]